MRILVCGGSGFIGRALCRNLIAQRHQVNIYTHIHDVTKILKKATFLKNTFGSPNFRLVNLYNEFPNVDVIINLSGESIAKKKLTHKRMYEILSSRLDTLDLLFEEYKLNDAEIAIVCMNSTAGTTKFVVDKLRNQGIKAGLLKIRVYRPFPAEEIAKALQNAKAVAVLDKSDSLNAAGGALFSDVTSAMFVNKVNVPTINYVYGIGGRDVPATDLESVYTDLAEIVKTGDLGNPYRFLGLRTKEGK